MYEHLSRKSTRRRHRAACTAASSDEKESVMERFKHGRIKILGFDDGNRVG